MIASFNTALKSSHQRHRLAAVAFYAELIHQRASGRDLDGVIRGLTSSLPDSSLLIRRIALKGLGALGDCDPRHLEALAPSVLNALMEGLEEDGREPNEGNSGTAREALEGLLRLVPVVSSHEVDRLASRLALRVRPFFEHELPQVRQAAISLLAQLFTSGSTLSTKSASAQLAEQVGTFTIKSV
jgi:HEAT repeat protein